MACSARPRYDSHSKGCNGYGAGAGDLIYAATPTKSGKLQIIYAAQYNAHVYVRTNCTNEGTEVICSGQDSGMGMFNVMAGKTYFVIMDGGNGETGSFQLTLSLLP